MRALSAEQRRSQQRADARRAILEATESLLVEEGYESFSIRRLVERCGYTAPTIYHHFGDKPGLLDALLEEVFQKLVRLIRRVPESGDPIAYLQALARAFVRFALRNPTHYRLLTQPRDSSSQPPRSAEEARELLEKPLLELWREGRLGCGDVRSASQSVWALSDGLIHLRTARPDYDWSKSLVDDSIEALLRGLIRPAAAKRPQRARRRREGR
jgi:TetR/AcrR family transcriptional regulator